MTISWKSLDLYITDRNSGGNEIHRKYYFRVDVEEKKITGWYHHDNLERNILVTDIRSEYSQIGDAPSFSREADNSFTTENTFGYNGCDFMDRELSNILGTNTPYFCIYVPALFDMDGVMIGYATGDQNFCLYAYIVDKTSDGSDDSTVWDTVYIELNTLERNPSCRRYNRSQRREHQDDNGWFPQSGILNNMMMPCMLLLAYYMFNQMPNHRMLKP